MESAKKALGLTKYFVALPPARYLVALLLLGTLLLGAPLGWAVSGKLDFWSLLSGAGSALIVVGIPSLLCAVLLAALRRRVIWQRALAVACLSAFVYLAADLLAAFLRPFNPAATNLIFIGFGLAFLLWLAVLKFAFGLHRFSWLFSLVQLVIYAFFLLAGSSLLSGAASDVVIKALLAGAVFVGALYGVLFVASGPMKKNLGVSSPDALSMFASQWLYGEKDLEEAFEEMGEEATTLIGVASFETKQGRLHWVVPYFHFGPFGNLGGSQFSYQIPQALHVTGEDHFVFHGTATHDLDPVSSSQLSKVLAACKKAISKIRPTSAKFSLTSGSSGDSCCYHLSINGHSLLSFTRAPLSTEDVNFAIGCALMERASRLGAGASNGKDSLAIDCHNAETGDVDYVEAGSPIAFEMSDALDAAMGKKAKTSAMQAGWASAFPDDIEGLASSGIRVTCLSGPDHRPSFFVLLDSNGIAGPAREKLIHAVRQQHGSSSFAEIFTSDTHQLNNVRGVFHPVGTSDYDKLEEAVLAATAEAFSCLAPAKFDLRKERLSLRVLGPYQSAEIVSTLNSAVSILRILLPVGLLVAIALLMWLLSKV